MLGERFKKNHPKSFYTSVIASASHDTASAIAAVSASGVDYIDLSSGTWSLMGVELDKPMITAESLNADMTNEGGVGNQIRIWT